MKSNNTVTKRIVYESRGGGRLCYVDIAKGIGLVLVVFGHLFSYGGNVSKVIFSFHMPLFFFLAGYCYVPSKNDNFEEYAIKKWRTLRIPYFLLAVVGFLFSIVIPSWHAKLGLYTILEIFYHCQPESLHVGQIWFLVCLFVSEFFSFWIYKYCFKRINCVCVIAILAVLAIGSRGLGIINRYLFVLKRFPFKVDSAIPAIVWYFIGFYFRKWFDNSIKDVSTISENNCKNLPIEIIRKISLPIRILLSCVLLGIDAMLSVKFLGWVNICALLFNNILLYWGVGFIGICGVIILALSFEDIKWFSNFFVYLGQNSLVLFGIHSLLIYFVCAISSFIYGYEIQNGMNVPNLIVFIGGIFIVVMFFPVIKAKEKMKVIFSSRNRCVQGGGGFERD